MTDSLFPIPGSRFARVGRVGKLLDRAAQAFAVGSGLTLLAMALMSFASVSGRSLLAQPIPGDYELVQVLSAIAVALSLPFCQTVRGHVSVDFFTTRLPHRAKTALDAIANLLLAVAALVIAWRMGVGLFELRANHDASMLLNIPTWYAYLPITASFLLLGATALYSAWEDFSEPRGR